MNEETLPGWAEKTGREMEQIRQYYNRRESLLNMTCSYYEHDELVELLRNYIISINTTITSEQIVLEHIKQLISRLDHYDIELKELNEKLKTEK
jgi:hypothetical protein